MSWSYDACYDRIDSPRGNIDLRVEFSNRLLGDYRWTVLIDVKENGLITTKRRTGRCADMGAAKSSARRVAKGLSRNGWTKRDEAKIPEILRGVGVDAPA
jgi:hypothetical protein